MSINSVKVSSQIPRRQYVAVPLYKGTGTYEDKGVQIDNGEYFRAHFRVGNYVDDNRGIPVTFTFWCDTADSAVAMLLYVGSTPTDNSEVTAWNIENATAFTFDHTTEAGAGYLSQYQYTLSAGDYAKGEMIYFLLQLNEAGRVVTCTSCEFEITVKA